VPLVVNDDVMLAVRSRAAGAHVGQERHARAAARKLLTTGWLGVSTHDPRQIAAAAAAGADYVGFGPCHPTATKGYEHRQDAGRDRSGGRRGGAAPTCRCSRSAASPRQLIAAARLGVDRIAVSARSCRPTTRQQAPPRCARCL
jgi:thiamine-phosphate pyrophosphorylase